MPPTDSDALSPLVRRLMSTLAGEPDQRAIALTAGERAELIDLLTRLVADAIRFNDHLLALRAARKEAGPEVEVRLLTGGSDIPWERIAADGFAGQSDDVLADLVTSPEALEAFRECHMADDGEMGQWYYDAILRNRPTTPVVVPRVVFPTESPTPVAATTPSERRPQGRRFLRWAVPAGLAAGLLFGVLGGWLLRGPGEKVPEPVALSGRAAFEPYITRGPNEGTQQLRVSSSADGFVVVIELSPDRNQFFRPSPGNEIPVGREGRSEGIPLRASTTYIVYAITETSAGESIRTAFDPDHTRKYQADQHADLKRAVADHLTKKGYRRFTVGSEAIPTTP